MFVQETRVSGRFLKCASNEASEHIANYARNGAGARGVHVHRRPQARHETRNIDRSPFVARRARRGDVDALGGRIIVAARSTGRRACARIAPSKRRDDDVRRVDRASAS